MMMSESAESVMSDHHWIERVIESQFSEQRSPRGDILPAFPETSLQVSTTSLSGEAAIRPAGAFFEDVTGALTANRTPLLPDSRILDFGCGWGRIGRMFLRDVSIESLEGIDVDPVFVEMTRELFGTDNFRVCEPFPPTDLEANHYSLVTAYSVFSHLSEAAAKAWLTEFARILKPGGHVAFTTRHDSFFDYVAWTRSAPDADPYTKALGQLFDDVQEPRDRLRAGEFVHATSRAVGGGGVRNESYYGESWIPEGWLDREFGHLFTRVATCFNGERYDQVAYILQKKKL